MQSKKINMSIHLLLEVFTTSLKLGLTSFGGPVAHLGYFRQEYVQRKKWIDDKSYADLVALCQFLPGPASSQVGMGIGMLRGGILGAIVAWIGFTMPSALGLVIFAYLFRSFDIGDAGWIHGLQIVAVAIVAQAVLGMGKNLSNDRNKVTITITAAIITLLWNTAWSQILIIIIAGITGLLLYKHKEYTEETGIQNNISRSFALALLAMFFILLFMLPVLRNILPIREVGIFDSFYRTGSLVFGGGHVVLPLLEHEVVPKGWITNQEFLAGYSAAQAVPGPLFTFAAYLGAIMNGWSGAALATAAIFLPSFLLVIGVLPFWDILRRQPKVQGALTGINAAVVGILLGALYNPVWTSSIKTSADFCLAILSFGMLMYWKLPPWLVVVFSALGGILVSHILNT